MKNPGYSSRKDFAARHATRRNAIRTPAAVAAAPAPKNTPAAIADIPLPDADEILRRARASKNRLAQPAGTGLFDLGNAPKPKDDIESRKPARRKPSAVNGTSESSQDRIKRLIREKRAKAPVAPPRVPKKLVIALEEPDEEETAEERIERRAKASALPRFGGPVLNELQRQGNRIDEKGYGGNRGRRRNRLKTGRRV
jgi:hypothetical protein